LLIIKKIADVPDFELTFSRFVLFLISHDN